MKRLLMIVGLLLAGLAFADRADAQNYVKDGFGKCMHVPQESRANGVQLRTWDCINKPHLKWKKTHELVVGEYFWLENNLTGKCAAVHKGKHQDGSPVVQWDCESSIHFQWILYGEQIKHRESGKCLHSASESNYAQLTIKTCAVIKPPPGGQWTYEQRAETQSPGAMVPSSTPSYLKNGFGTCLHVPYNSRDNGTQLTTWDCQDLRQILWSWEGLYDFSGFRAFFNDMNGKCMAVHAGQKQDGTKVIQWTCGPERLSGHNFHWQQRDGQLFHRESGKCLQVASSAKNSPATLGPCAQLVVPAGMKWTIGG